MPFQTIYVGKSGKNVGECTELLFQRKGDKLSEWIGRRKKWDEKGILVDRVMGRLHAVMRPMPFPIMRDRIRLDDH